MVGILTRKKVLKAFLLTLLFNTIIAVFLNLMGYGLGFASTLVVAQCIGLSIFSTVFAGMRLVTVTSMRGYFVLAGVTLILGSLVGAVLGSRITGVAFAGMLGDDLSTFLQRFSAGLLFGVVINYFFFSSARIKQSETLLREEQIKTLTLEKRSLEADLKLLQAQIEPHFLFNTLSNILSLMDSDPGRGKTMLMDLTRYLRSSLNTMRKEATSLGREVEMLKAYLDLHKVRMGDRLRYSIAVPEALMGHSLPPMLLQPIVENAVKHGIEPKISGGEINIGAVETSGLLRLSIVDTGCGINGNVKGGIGLANVEERLAVLYNGKARLILEENQPSGLKVTIEIPHEAS
jgi:sensor histidine kinase YesM